MLGAHRQHVGDAQRGDTAAIAVATVDGHRNRGLLAGAEIGDDGGRHLDARCGAARLHQDGAKFHAQEYAGHDGAVRVDPVDARSAKLGEWQALQAFRPPTRRRPHFADGAGAWPTNGKKPRSTGVWRAAAPGTSGRSCSNWPTPRSGTPPTGQPCSATTSGRRTAVTSGCGYSRGWPVISARSSSWHWPSGPRTGRPTTPTWMRQGRWPPTSGCTRKW